MFQSQVPVIICIFTAPEEKTGVEAILKKQFELQTASKSIFPTYQGNITVENIIVEVFLKLLQIDNQYKQEKKKSYRNSIGAIYIYRKQAYFDILSNIYQELKPLSAFSPYESLFIKIKSIDESNSLQEGIPDLDVKKVQLNPKDPTAFLEYLKDFITESQFFQVTIRGSCEVNFG
ncbi:MAG: hypothetical protein ACTSW1_16365 [Candidatus Hodarchaeales archaeon]